MEKNKFKNLAWAIDVETYLEIVELAIKHGKKSGDNMHEEFEEILKKKKDKFELLGGTDKDIDLITGDLREKGLKILNIKEIHRRKKGERKG